MQHLMRHELFKYNGPVAVQQDAMFDKPLHGTRQHNTLDVTPDGRQRIRFHRVIHAFNILLDDRALVQIARDEMRGRPNQLHAAFVRLVVRLGAFEARQEGMMDIDSAAL